MLFHWLHGLFLSHLRMADDNIPSGDLYYTSVIYLRNVKREIKTMELDFEVEAGIDPAVVITQESVRASYKREVCAEALKYTTGTGCGLFDFDCHEYLLANNQVIPVTNFRDVRKLVSSRLFLFSFELENEEVCFPKTKFSMETFSELHFLKHKRNSKQEILYLKYANSLIQKPFGIQVIEGNLCGYGLYKTDHKFQSMTVEDFYENIYQPFPDFLEKFQESTTPRKPMFLVKDPNGSIEKFDPINKKWFKFRVIWLPTLLSPTKLDTRLIGECLLRKYRRYSEVYMSFPNFINCESEELIPSSELPNHLTQWHSSPRSDDEGYEYLDRYANSMLDSLLSPQGITKASFGKAKSY